MLLSIVYKNIILFYEIKSFVNGLKSFFYADRVLVNKNGEKRKILLLAMYEKYLARNDVLNLVKHCKSLNIYVVAVNTRKLNKENSREFLDNVDVYIERYNYGRDFGSYKTGMNFLYQNGCLDSCDRLIILNDSVYYDKSRLPNLIDVFSKSNIDVLGATENFEFTHHLGSFALSFSSYIINHKKFKRYWAKYINSDVRPHVIKNGELKLNKLLKKIARSDDSYKALYDSTYLREHFLFNKDSIFKFSKFTRSESTIGPRWGVVTPSSLLKSFLITSRVVFSENVISQLGTTLRSINTESENKYNIYPKSKIDIVTSIESCRDVLKRLTGTDDAYSDFLRYAENKCIDSFRMGSQIHQNPGTLLYLGLPIVKLDGFFRGLFVEEDVGKIQMLMDATEFIELTKLLYSKPYGLDHLTGIDKLAFNLGIL